MKNNKYFSLLFLTIFITCLLVSFTGAQDQPLVTDPDVILSDPLYVYPLEPGSSAWLSGPYSTLNYDFEILYPWYLGGADWPTEPLWMTDIAIPVPNSSGTALRYILGGDSFGEVDVVIDNCPYNYWYRPFLANNVFINSSVHKDVNGYILSVEFTGNDIAYQEYPIGSDDYGYYANIIPLSEKEQEFNEGHDPADPFHPNGCQLSVYPVDYFYQGSVLYVLTGTQCWGLGCKQSCKIKNSNPPVYDDVSEVTGIGLFKYTGTSAERIKFYLYENEELLWGPETHYWYVAAIRTAPYGSSWVCFMGTQQPIDFPPSDPEEEQPENWNAMMACVQKNYVENPQAYYYWVGPSCHWSNGYSYAPAEVNCPVATADHLSPISIEKYKGWWRLIYAAIYWNGKQDPERYTFYNGTQYEAVKIWKTNNILNWTNNSTYRQVHPLTNLRADSDIFSFNYAPHWYPPSIYSGPDMMYFNTSIWLYCEGNGEQTWGIRYDAAHYMYWVP